MNAELVLGAVAAIVGAIIPALVAWINLSDRTGRLTRQIEDLEEKIAELRMEQERERAEFQRKIDALEAENTELRRELDGERSKRRELSERMAKIDRETAI